MSRSNNYYITLNEHLTIACAFQTKYVIGRLLKRYMSVSETFCPMALNCSVRTYCYKT